MTARWTTRYLALITLWLLACLTACSAAPATQAVRVAAPAPTRTPTVSLLPPSPTVTTMAPTHTPTGQPSGGVLAAPQPSATPPSVPQQGVSVRVDVVDGAWLPDGVALVVAEIPMLRILDGRTLEERTILGEGPGYVAAAVGPQRVIAASADNTVQVWDAEGGTLVRVLEGANQPVEGTAYEPTTSQIVGVTVSPDGTRVAAAVRGYYEGGQGSVWLWDMETAERLAILSLYGAPSGVAFSPDGKLLAASTLVSSCGRGGGGITLWDAATQEVEGMLSAQGDAVTAFAFHPDGGRVAGVGQGTGQGRCVGPVVVHEWEIATGAERMLAVEGTTPTAVDYQPMSGSLLVGYEDGTLRLWDADAQEPQLTVAAHEGSVRGVAFNPEGDRVVSWGDDWNLALRAWGGSEVAGAVTPMPRATAADAEHVTDDASLNQVNSLAFAPDDPLTLWAGTAAGVVRWDLRTDRPTRYTAADGLSGDLVNDLAFGPDGALWAATLSGVSRYAGERWTSFFPGEGLPAAPVYALAIAPDGSLWMGTQEGAARYDGESWTVYAPADGLADALVWSVGVTPNGAVWFSTHGGGVSRYDPITDTWRTFGADDGLPLPNARQLAVEPGANGDAGVWVHIGYDNVYRFDGTRWVLAYPSGGGRWVCGMAFDGQGNPWLATCDGYHTYGVGLVHREGPQAAWSAVTTEEGLISHSLLCVAVAPAASNTQPSLAVGTMQGISVYQDGVWRALLVE